VAKKAAEAAIGLPRVGKTCLGASAGNAPPENWFAPVPLALVRKLWVLTPHYDTWVRQMTQADEEGILICEELIAID